MTTELDPAAFRTVLGHYPTGVAVVTGQDVEGPVGMVVGSFSSVSLDPPLVSFMPTRSSATYARLRTAAAYCINVLAFDQLELCRTMTRSDADTFDRVRWEESEHGVPVLSGVVAHVRCVPHQVVEAGDHYIVLCRVTGLDVVRPVAPLLFFKGGYGLFKALGPPSEEGFVPVPLGEIRHLGQGWG